MTAHTSILITEPHDGVCLLTLNRSHKRNALDGILIREWMEALQQIEQNPSIRVVIFNGNGKHFCAGADMAWMQKMARCSSGENVEDALGLANLLKAIYTFPKVTMSYIQGATMGGGLGVIACCDMVIAADNSVFCFSEAKIGLTPSVISPYILSVMGERLARYYFLTAEKFNAETAQRLQLVQHIVPMEKLADTSMTLAKNILKNSPHALTEAKKLIQCLSRQIVPDELVQMTAKHLAFMRASHDAEEGLKAFLEKRPPVWE